MNWYRKIIEASRKMPKIDYGIITKFLQGLGFEYVGTTGSHEKWSNAAAGKTISMKAKPYWGSNAKNIAEYVLKDAGIAPAEFAENVRQHKDYLKNPLGYHPEFAGQVQDSSALEFSSKEIELFTNKSQADPNDPSDWRNYLEVDEERYNLWLQSQ